ncbi:MAG: hypothetical protein CML05_20585 [Pseudozobellia sp.]|nr:hypothetical protein [Pseudozobellia sp.]|tara:strand:+ start:70882 stop:72165 length:1284 start_codon:yes stop_codon:yes gene_type:complete
MREDLLHFIWKYKKLALHDLESTDGEALEIINFGQHNQLAGPDFFNAQIKIDGQLWAGNLEIHLKSSDWYAHKHEEDSNYKNVILHVVWQHDCHVLTEGGTHLVTLELKNYISNTLLTAYQNLMDSRNTSFINCENNIGSVSKFHMNIWLERLYFERLEQKSVEVAELLKRTNNDWEGVLFALLLKGFGSKVNGPVFIQLAKVIDFKIIRKVQSNVRSLEGLFYGMLQLLEADDILDDYYLGLKKEYEFLKVKFGLGHKFVGRPEFYGLRPPNFPTIRLSQLANLYYSNDSLFAKLMEAETSEQMHGILKVVASDYWSNHYTFGKESKGMTKVLSKTFVDLLIINSILPVKYLYSKSIGKNSDEQIIDIMSAIPSEKNVITRNFQGLNLSLNNAFYGQGAIQLYNNYCKPNKCLQCQIGASLLSGNV